MINCAKYEQMNQSEIFKILKSEEEKLNQQMELVVYLRNKLKNDFYDLKNAPSIIKLDAEFEKLSPLEQDEILNEVKKEMHG
ncbi:formate dehydrogenase [Campylobacter sp. FMV-PI01]|uniref:Formate dehydrogenase n=1 Tax=Campylobacter portucalensis TaxID=2608384 RepID=A0A6L5WLB7_9BACT|nr:formate dehydrogenase [Campylobacter portucalensis]MSN97172.1 formate dehydrogenase [Campylobacter portucalensis]